MNNSTQATTASIIAQEGGLKIGLIMAKSIST
jgi:hypothetical protein